MKTPKPIIGGIETLNGKLQKVGYTGTPVQTSDDINAVKTSLQPVTQYLNEQWAQKEPLVREIIDPSTYITQFQQTIQGFVDEKKQELTDKASELSQLAIQKATELGMAIAESMLPSLPSIPDVTSIVSKIRGVITDTVQMITDTKTMLDVTVDTAKDNMYCTMLVEYEKQWKKIEAKKKRLDEKQKELEEKSRRKQEQRQAQEEMINKELGEATMN